MSLSLTCRTAGVSSASEVVRRPSIASALRQQHIKERQAFVL